MPHRRARASAFASALRRPGLARRRAPGAGLRCSPSRRTRPFSFVISVSDQSGRPVRDLEAGRDRRHRERCRGRDREGRAVRDARRADRRGRQRSAERGRAGPLSNRVDRPGARAARGHGGDAHHDVAAADDGGAADHAIGSGCFAASTGLRRRKTARDSPIRSSSSRGATRPALKETNRIASVPMLLMVSTTVTEAVSYSARGNHAGAAVSRAAKGQGARGDAQRQAERVSPRRDRRRAADDDRDSGHESDEGRYETLANSNRLATLLPEMGTEIAALHRRQVNQLLVTARRQPGRRGPLQNPQIGLTRKGMTGSVSLDGLP